jgi:hypothetical protein
VDGVSLLLLLLYLLAFLATLAGGLYLLNKRNARHTIPVGAGD